MCGFSAAKILHVLKRALEHQLRINRGILLEYNP